MQVLESQHGLAHPLPQIAGEKIIALLPGSRKQEILKKLPEMLSVVSEFPQYHFAIAQAPGLDDEWFASLVPSHKNVHIVKDNTYALLNHSVAAIVTSGTATLETALFQVPEVVCYKGGKISYLIAKQLIKVKYISLVNLILDRLVVAELIQAEMNVDRVNVELKKVLEEGPYRNKMLADYQELKVKLGGGGASQRVAESIVNDLKK